ncbi:hypothetical protein AURDEDRAFT_116335, partial [Auricularia subglabra TFB-10046 SS5]
MNYTLPSPSPPRSPASSISSSGRHEDATTFAEKSMSDQAFARRTEDALMLHVPRDAPFAQDSVLLPRPKTEHEEKMLHARVMANLRQRVAELEEDELFDSVSSLQRGNKPGLEPQPSSNDVHAIIAGAMQYGAPPQSSATKRATPSRSVSSTVNASSTPIRGGHTQRSSVTRQI